MAADGLLVRLKLNLVGTAVSDGSLESVQNCERS